jgi:hypothetical protein
LICAKRGRRCANKKAAELLKNSLAKDLSGTNILLAALQKRKEKLDQPHLGDNLREIPR